MVEYDLWALGIMLLELWWVHLIIEKEKPAISQDTRGILTSRVHDAGTLWNKLMDGSRGADRG